MILLKYFKKGFNILKTYLELRKQLDYFHNWGRYLNKIQMNQQLFLYSYRLYLIHKTIRIVDVKINLFPEVKVGYKNVALIPKLMIHIPFSCCYVIKMIAFPLEDKVRFSVLKGSKLILSGECGFFDCISQIKNKLNEEL